MGVRPSGPRGSSGSSIIRTGFLGDKPRGPKDLERNWKGILQTRDPHVGRLQNESSEVLEETRDAWGGWGAETFGQQGAASVGERDQRLSPGGSAGLRLASMPGKNIPGEGTAAERLVSSQGGGSF